MSYQADHKDNNEEKPPVFGSWQKFYMAVIAWLVILIIFFYLFTKHFS